MNIEPIGVATMAIGLACLLMGMHATIIAFLFATLFGSAAAFFVGSANIQPAHAFLVFVLIAVLSRHRDSAHMLHAFRADRAGFWLAALTLYSLLTAYFLPRVLAGTTQIIPLGVTEFDGAVVPLTTVSSNLTHSVYLIGDLLCFAAMSAVASASPAGLAACVTGMLAYAAGNALFAAIDVATFYTGTDWLLSFMRNAQYVLHTDVQIFGMKRIVGSFTEASSMGRSTLGALAFTGTLWLCGFKPWLTGSLAAASAIILAASTSSTGLAGVPVVAVLLYLTALSRAGLAPHNRNGTTMVLLLPPLIVALLLVFLMVPSVWHAGFGYVDFILLQKAESNSGLERSSWNDYALQNFIDTWGLGVGLGTARTSGLIHAYLANVGIVGSLLYLMFMMFVVLRARPRRPTSFGDWRAAACNGLLGLLIGDLLVSPSIDQGLLFYAFAALATAYPERSQQVSPQLDPVGLPA